MAFGSAARTAVFAATLSLAIAPAMAVQPSVTSPRHSPRAHRTGAADVEAQGISSSNKEVVIAVNGPISFVAKSALALANVANESATGEAGSFFPWLLTQAAVVGIIYYLHSQKRNTESASEASFALYAVARAVASHCSCPSTKGPLLARL
eukprot:CAMPEP_0117521598 /NCGR_PEP_ID=MMETSP0784-20121206/33769_1 /TAXON_ID=39447 /ORGANISM="" /LENGTH=150 /DNA_ID=CAMNT_0005317633 /DNA_START=41 /DNA_END=494 /DNA_ORIENTATION=-